MLVFCLEREVHALVSNSFVIAMHFVIKSRATCRPKSRCQSDLSTVSVLPNRSLHQDLMHSGCRGTAVPLNVCLQAFSLFPLPSSPLDQRPVHRLGLTLIALRTTGPSALKLRANGRNYSYHCWPNIVGRCCIRLHTTTDTDATNPIIVGPTMLGVVAFVSDVAKSLTGFLTLRNNSQQHATGCTNGRNM